MMLGLIILMAQVIPGCHMHVYDDDPIVIIPPCNNGPSGYNGSSFLGLDYWTVEPSYIWGNNTAIPSYFHYGLNYLSNPGTFYLYYEGSYIDGCCLVQYYWDVEYNVWYHPGSVGGPCGQPGVNGADSFLTIWMDPLGPDFSRINKKGDESIRLVLDSPDKKIVEQVIGDKTVKIVYTKLKESQKGKQQGGFDLEGSR